MITFVILVVVLSVPFWILGGTTGLRLVEGLPVSALMAFCPLVAAVILTHRERSIEGVMDLLKRAFDYQRITSPIWYVPIFLLRPAVMVASYFVLRAMGTPLPPLRFSIPTAAVLFVLFFMTAVGEEVGWSGYATDRLQVRWSALQTGLVLGVVWATWHIVPLVQVGRPASWILWQVFNTVATRVIIVWVYNHAGGSVFAAVLCHTVDNVSWLMFPDFGSHYDPKVTGLIMGAVAVVVSVTWPSPTAIARISATSPCSS